MLSSESDVAITSVFLDKFVAAATWMEASLIMLVEGVPHCYCYPALFHYSENT
jgi:hypothetical protein